MTTVRLHPDARKQQILLGAMVLAGKSGGFATITRAAVAKECGCAESLVSKYCGTMINFRREIMRAAIRTENLSILAQGLACGDRCAQKAPPALRQKAIDTLKG